MRSQDRGDGVRLVQDERAIRAGRDADLFGGARGDRLVEPHAFDVGDVFDQTEQRGLRRHQVLACLLLGKSIEAVTQRVPIGVEQLVQPVPHVLRPLG